MFSFPSSVRISVIALSNSPAISSTPNHDLSLPKLLHYPESVCVCLCVVDTYLRVENSIIDELCSSSGAILWGAWFHLPICDALVPGQTSVLDSKHDTYNKTTGIMIKNKPPQITSPPATTLPSPHHSPSPPPHTPPSSYSATKPTMQPTPPRDSPTSSTSTTPSSPHQSP